MSSRQSDEDIEIDDAPIGINPYEVLSVEKDATLDQIKSAYRRAALKHHPDKASAAEKENAHVRFQEVAFAYAILSDERRRKRYDTTGNTSESLDLENDDFDWLAFYREQYAGVVTEATINKFADSYRHSEEERMHLLAAYKKHKGSMPKVYEEVMLSDMLEDEERFRKIIDKAIEDGEVESYASYINESEKSRKRRMDRERTRREKHEKRARNAAGGGEDDFKSEKSDSKGKNGHGSTSDLLAMIQQRQKSRAEDFFDRLEAKYSAPSGKSSTKRTALDEPPEEAFARNKKTAKTANGDVTESSKRNQRSRMG